MYTTVYNQLEGEVMVIQVLLVLPLAKMSHWHSREFASRESRENGCTAENSRKCAKIFSRSDRVIAPARSNMGSVGAVGFHRISERSGGGSRSQASGLMEANQRQRAVGKHRFSHRSLVTHLFFFFLLFFLRQRAAFYK